MSNVSPKTYIKLILKLFKTPFVEEHKFHPTRRFLFDWAIPERKIAIEYEGLMSAKSRHTTIKGYSKDTEKYNEAAKMGWVVLRYTALTYKNIREDLKELGYLESK